MSLLLKLSVKSIRYRKAALLLSIVSISLSVVLLLGVERLRSNVQESFTSSIAGTDLIVGARSSNISLLLATVFHIGNQSQNIRWETYEQISSLPEVDWTIPIALGDSHKGFPVVGTNGLFFQHFSYGFKQVLEPSTGVLHLGHTGCVIGAKVAEELGYNKGDALVVTHGMGLENFVEHDDEPFVVEAILKPTGTPVDRNVFVSLNALADVHAEFYGDEAEQHDVFSKAIEARGHEGHDDHEKNPESLTALWVGLRSHLDVLGVQRELNNYTAEPLTAIMPVVTLIDLWEFVRPIEAALFIISCLVLVVALGGIVTTIITGLNERRREMAILRSVGAKPYQIFGLILMESLGIVFCGLLAGVLVLQAVSFVSIPLLARGIGVVVPTVWLTANDLAALTVILLVSVLMGAIPAYLSYKKTMKDGLMIK